MKQKLKESITSFQEKYPCPYFEDGRLSALEYLFPDQDIARSFHKFLARGYRRLGRVFYRNVCEECSACLPLRIEVEKFALGKSHKRTLRKNEDLVVKILPRPSITPENIMLYHKYVSSKHANKADEYGDIVNVLLNIHYGYAQTVEMDYFLGDKLIGVGIVDKGNDSLSSNYFYYDTDYLRRRPGVFSVLQELSLARALGKKYYYLGFYIQENAKMSYKKDFRPNQVYEKGKWREFIRA